MGRSTRDENGFTPGQSIIWGVLRDGEWHSRGELLGVMDYLPDEITPLKLQVSLMRKIVAKKGLLITASCSATSGWGYQVTRKLAPADV